MNSEQLKEFYDKYFYYILFADIGIGLLFGAIPLILGVRRKKRNLGIIGLVIAGVFGALSPILSIIIAAVFALLIVSRSTAEKTVGVDETLRSE
ncbi:MAG: hypothetical protein ABIO36_05025 [Pyrinomonadaceae bacterium]